MNTYRVYFETKVRRNRLFYSYEDEYNHPFIVNADEMEVDLNGSLIFKIDGKITRIMAKGSYTHANKCSDGIMKTTCNVCKQDIEPDETKIVY